MVKILPPTASIDWDQISIATNLGLGHVESTYHMSTGRWSDPVFVNDPYLRVHGLAPGLQYGQQCYEGLKAFRTPKGRVSIFRPDKHAKRMSHSTSTISIPNIPESLFLASVELAVTSNSSYIPPHTSRAMLYIRPFAFGSSEMIGLVPPSEFKFCVYVKPVPAYHGLSAQDALILMSFDRAAPHGLGHAKVGGNYAPVIKWSEQAKADGFGMTLHLDSKTRTEIDEFSTSGFLGIKVSDEGLSQWWHPVAPALSTVQQATAVFSLLGIMDGKWKRDHYQIKYTELPEFSEVVAVGTAASVVSIRSITLEDSRETVRYLDVTTNQGRYARKLSTSLDDIMHCRVEDVFGWCHQVGEAPVEDVTTRKMGSSNKKPAFVDIMTLSCAGQGARFSCH
ncbi:Aminotransferase apf4 [Fusarium culmorum]|uniref:Aminotransferase apf4 n=1 Tax=Fusarium culmorum TaxID=5516 RepID=A0A2T4GRI5_FUSCU|nr:Aminotransferase apf4 [Fusarium culmorum]